LASPLGFVTLTSSLPYSHTGSGVGVGIGVGVGEGGVDGGQIGHSVGGNEGGHIGQSSQTSHSVGGNDGGQVGHTLHFPIGRSKSSGLLATGGAAETNEFPIINADAKSEAALQLN